MKITLNWLKEFVDIELSPQELADKLTSAGLEVEGIQTVGDFPDSVVVAKILKMEKHPDADRLTLCEVELGEEKRTIVCGAKNMKEGDLVPLALPGTVLPDGKKIEAGKIRGIVSCGMLCSETELGLAESASGLLILPQNLKSGLPLKKQLPLSDVIFEINVTPNRSDCLSVLGIAREVAVLTSTKLKKSPSLLELSNFSTSDFVDVEINNSECAIYSARVIKDLKVKPSPIWVQKRLEWVGLRSINNVVDATNYVMIERGQPVHAFDLSKIENKKIVIQKYQSSLGTFETLDATKPKFENSDLLISDDKKILAIAGVMGGKDSGVQETTQDIVLEVANFNADSVRKTSKRLGISSESSYRFERGVDAAAIEESSLRLAELILSWAGGKLAKDLLIKQTKELQKLNVSLNKQKLIKVLGCKIEDDVVEKILSYLQFNPKKEGDTWKCQVPSYRNDISREIDLIEEVARIWSYDNIPSTLPLANYRVGTDFMSSAAQNKVKNFLKSLGFHELINYSFVSAKELEQIHYNIDNCIQLANPLSDELAVMRPTLLASLLASAKSNFALSNKNLKFFELRKVYSKNSNHKIQEHWQLGVLLSGDFENASWRSQASSSDFYDLKGVLESIFSVLHIPAPILKEEAGECFHPGLSAKAFLNSENSQQKEVAELGCIHPRLLETMQIGQKVWLALINFDELMNWPVQKQSFQRPSKLPGVGRDLTLQAPLNLKNEEVLKAIQDLNVEFLHSVNLVAYFDKAPIPQGKKALTYHLYYQNEERTLTDEEVNNIHKSAVEKLQTQLSVEWR